MKELNYKTIHNYLSLIYKDFNTKEIDKICHNIKTLFSKRLSNKNINQLWTEKDSFLITYADTVRNKSQNHLKTLDNFLNLFCKDFSHIHILPYYPSSSDDGFAVIDYKRISKENGTWADFEKLTSKFKIMSDLVINHCSSESNLFNDKTDGSSATNTEMVWIPIHVPHKGKYSPLSFIFFTWSNKYFAVFM